MSFTNLFLRISGYPIAKAKKKLQEIHNIPNEKYVEYVEKKKKEIVEFHLKNNPFYKELVQKKDWSWEELPILTKSDIQVDLKDRISKTVDSYYENKTSGSTGNPFYFAKDKFSHALTWANIQSCFDQHGLYGQKQARFYGIPKGKKDYFLARFKDFFLNRYRFDVFDLTDTALKGWVDNFSKSKYVYLNGYTTVLVSFAKYLKSQNIVLNDICPTLKKCVVTSEMCFPEDKKMMEAAYGVPVVNEYGASELDLIAFQNNKNEWLLNTSTLFIEFLGKDNLPVQEGELGRLVITSLYNTANPFIRYDLGDSGRILRVDSKKIILKELIGRNEDYVKLPSGKKAPGLTFYYVTKSVMEKSSYIKEIRVIQTKIDAFELEYVSKAALSFDQKNEIQKAMVEYLEPNINIEFKRLSSLKRAKSGKLKQFTSLIK